MAFFFLKRVGLPGQVSDQELVGNVARNTPGLHVQVNFQQAVMDLKQLPHAETAGLICKFNLSLRGTKQSKISTQRTIT